MQPRKSATRSEQTSQTPAYPTQTIVSLNAGDGPGSVVINALVQPIALHALGAAGNAPGPLTIEVMPAPGAGGLLPSRCARRQRVADGPRLVEALNAQALRARVDFDHKSEPTSPTFAGDTSAEGWLSDYRLNSRGGIDADAELGTAALQSLRDKKYRYVSPALMLNHAGDVVGLSSIALVNNPNLPLEAPALNTETDDVKTKEQLAAEAALAERMQKLAERESAFEKRALNAAESNVDAAIEAGRILPAQRDFYLGAIKTHADGIEAGTAAFNAVLATPEDKKTPTSVLAQRIGPTGQPPADATRMNAAYQTPAGWSPPGEERLDLHAKIADYATKRGIPYRQAALEFGVINGV